MHQYVFPFPLEKNSFAFPAGSETIIALPSSLISNGETPEYPKKLVGIIEGENSSNGHFESIPSPVLIGDSEKAKDCCMNGIKIDDSYAGNYGILGSLCLEQDLLQEGMNFLRMAAKLGDQRAKDILGE